MSGLYALFICAKYVVANLDQLFPCTLGLCFTRLVVIATSIISIVPVIDTRITDSESFELRQDLPEAINTYPDCAKTGKGNAMSISFLFLPEVLH